MKVTIPLESQSMGSRLQKKLKSSIMKSLEVAVDQILSDNPSIHEGKIIAKAKPYPQMTSTVGESTIGVELKVKFKS